MKREAKNNDFEENKKLKKNHPFFDMKQKTAQAIKWINALDSVVIGKSRGKDFLKNKIAAFDLDGTLIKNKSGRTYAKNEHDWCWWNPIVPKRIETLSSEGYEIVIFTNQNGLNSEKKIEIFKKKISYILDELTPPVFVMAAKEKDKYRKPMTGMWDWFVEQHGEKIDKDASFYVGDAAGRHRKPIKDHSCCDRKLAYNIQIPFYTPEEFFLKEEKSAFEWWGFNAKEHPLNLPVFSPALPGFPASDKNEVVVCVGYPASGKSSFAKKHLVPQGYVYVNQDELKNKDKCIQACKNALNDHKSVVIDNTNPEAATRKLYIDLAKQANVSVRCLYFGGNQDLADHNNYYRANYKANRKLIPVIAFRIFKSKLQEPTLNEGFSEIKHVNFVFDGNKTDFEEWKKWWL
ncbi:hypothetical protein G6F56_000275 [Rhizopus delemar]|nr:hypothetical protein G6F56_000275 [Rhizopus delemar]